MGIKKTKLARHRYHIKAAPAFHNRFVYFCIKHSLRRGDLTALQCIKKTKLAFHRFAAPGQKCEQRCYVGKSYIIIWLRIAQFLMKSRERSTDLYFRIRFANCVTALKVGRGLVSEVTSLEIGHTEAKCPKYFGVSHFPAMCPNFCRCDLF